MSYQRFKVTKTGDASGKIQVTINPTKDLKVISAYVTIGATTLNYARNVNLERSDGTILGQEWNEYTTSETSNLVFPTSFIIPHFDPILVVNTATIAVNVDITIDLIYEEVKLA